MTTNTPQTMAQPTAQAHAFKATHTPVPHDMSCARCQHGLHVYLACGDGCQCSPQTMPGTAA